MSDEDRQDKALELEREMRSRELDIKERELEQNVAKAGFSTQAAIIAGALSLTTAVVSNAISGCWSQQLAERQHARGADQEKRNQEFQILLAATKDRTPQESAENLKFFIDIGYLSDPGGKIKAKAENNELPVISSVAPERGNPILERAKLIDRQVNQFSVENGLLLGPLQIARYEAKSNGKMANPEIIVFHFTAGVGFDRIVNHMVDEGYGPHLCIGRKGEIAQIMPFDYWGHHAGNSSWNGIRNVSAVSIGIEMENWGPLSNVNGKWVTWSDIEVPAAEVVEIDGKGWQRFTDVQIDTATKVAEALVKNYPSIKGIVGHSDVSEGRKTDPGPAFPIHELQKFLSTHPENPARSK